MKSDMKGQMTLFDLLENDSKNQDKAAPMLNNSQKTAKKTSAAKVNEVKAGTIPEQVMDFHNALFNAVNGYANKPSFFMKEFISRTGKAILFPAFRYNLILNEHGLKYSDCYSSGKDYFFLKNINQCKEISILYKVEKCVYETTVKLDVENIQSCNPVIKSIRVSRKPVLVSKICKNVIFINLDGKTLSEDFPYSKEWVDQTGISEELFYMAPYLEQLDKAGYKKLVHSAIKAYENHSDSDIDMFNRLTQRGTSLKTIFKTPKAVYSQLKDCGSIRDWDNYRKLVKMGKVNASIIEDIYAMHFSAKELDYISVILGCKYQGKQVFSFDSLLNYLQRIDQFEAISSAEALPLLKDYLNMCRILEIKPKIDGDSLKREHDVTARTLRQKKREINAQKMAEVYQINQRYDWERGPFLIRAVKDYDDLIDEAQQQHNCVASYYDSIISQKSRIFLMREKAHPDISLVTVELSRDCKQIRQKYLAYNRPIHNSAQTDFLNSWLKWVKRETA